MTAFYLGKASRARLAGVHPDLVVVVATAITLTETDFAVTEGLRSIERQHRLVETGASRTLNSRHLTGHAVDLAPYDQGTVSWAWPLFDIIAEAVKEAAARCRVAIVWGGDWPAFRDGPHFELDRRDYPSE